MPAALAAPIVGAERDARPLECDGREDERRSGAVTEAIVAVVGLLVFAWAVASGKLARRNVTGPLVFVIAGYLIGNPDWGPLPVAVGATSVHVVAEVTLALVLFADAARVNVHELRRDIALPVRLLGIGLLLSVIIGALLAGGLLKDIPWGLAGFLGAALAPTDAALSVQVITDERIPMRLRRALNVESGLNDGIVTPIVTVMLAVAASQLGAVSHGVSFEVGAAFRELAVGAGIGLVAGAGGGTLISVAARRGWIAAGGRQLATLALALSAFAAALALDANGFIAAFVAGAAFGATLDTRVTELERADELPELGGEFLALVVWFLFGATLLPIAVDHLGGHTVVYALLSLSVVRMVPVALALQGAGLDRPSVVFIAWFGPRGLASVVFVLLAVEELGVSSPAVTETVAAAVLTVVLSVVLHGITAGPGGRSYVHHEHAQTETPPPARRQALAAPTLPADIPTLPADLPAHGT